MNFDKLVHYRMSSDMYAELRAVAKKKGIKVSAAIRKALEKYIRKHKG